MIAKKVLTLTVDIYDDATQEDIDKFHEIYMLANTSSETSESIETKLEGPGFK